MSGRFVNRLCEHAGANWVFVIERIIFQSSCGREARHGRTRLFQFPKANLNPAKRPGSIICPAGMQDAG